MTCDARTSNITRTKAQRRAGLAKGSSVSVVIERPGTMRIEVDLSSLAIGMRGSTADALRDALLNARGGAQGNISGVIDDAAISGDMLTFIVSLDVIDPDELASTLGREDAIGLADRFALHESCFDADDIQGERADAADDMAGAYNERIKRMLSHLDGMEPEALASEIALLARERDLATMFGMLDLEWDEKKANETGAARA